MQGADTTINGQDDYYCRYTLAATTAPGSADAAIHGAPGLDDLEDQATYNYIYGPV